MRRALLIAGLWLALLAGAGAEALPPKPAAYFNDYARVVPAGTVAALDARLRQFERDTSNQILVAVFPKMDSASSVQDYTVRVAASWKVGQAARDNGAVLFVFIADRQMFIQVGSGLEGALPDITCKQIVENEIKPAFKAGNYAAGLTAGVEAMMRAARGEYRGAGRVAGEGTRFNVVWLVVGFFALILLLQVLQSWRAGVVYSRNGRSFASGFLLNMLSAFADSATSSSRRGGGGGWSGGGGGGGGGGGFSGGGGSFGGGGAGGSW